MDRSPQSRTSRTPRRPESPRTRLASFLAISAVAHGSAWVALALGVHTTRGPAFDLTPETLTGETLDIDPDVPAPDIAAEPEPGDPERTPAPTPKQLEPGTRLPRLPAHSAAGPSSGPSRSAALYGAVGVRYATDLPTTFTRLFAQVASADPIWQRAAFGAAGTAIVTMALDDAGHLVGETVEGMASLALREGIDRTLAGLKLRTFTARTTVTRLHVSANVQRDAVHDGLHGEVFALSGGSFTGDEGTAFFALPGPAGGRRVDVELRVMP